MAAVMDVTFTKITMAMQDHGNKAAAALINLGRDVNQTFSIDNRQAPPPLNDASIKLYFGRGALELQYLRTISPELSSTGTPNFTDGINVAVAAKLQSDFLSGVERDFRMQRGTTRVRSVTMAASRRLAHGNQYGPVASGIVGPPQGYIKMGSLPTTTTTTT